MLILDRRLLLTPFLQLQRPLQPPAFKHRQTQTGPERKTARAPTAQIRQLQGLKPEVAGQRDARIKIGPGHTDGRRCGVQVRVSPADVRATLRQLARHTNGHIALVRRHLARGCQLRLQGTRRLAQQQAQGIDQLRAVLLQRRQARLHLGHLRGGFRHFQIRGNALLHLQLGQLQRALRNLQVLLHHRLRLLGAAQLDVLLRRLPDHQQLHAVPVFLGHAHRGVGRLH